MGNLSQPKVSPFTLLTRDLSASFVVTLVALPLCLGIALASNAPLFSGIVAGILGGLVVGALSGSHTSVSGPAAGLTAIVATQIHELGSFEAFLAATFVAGAIQVALGVARAGFIAAFFPSSVVKGLLSAIGILLVIKQVPYAVGYDAQQVTQSVSGSGHGGAFGALATGVHPAAFLIGVVSLGVLVSWSKIERLDKGAVPAPVVVVVLGVCMSSLSSRLDPHGSLTSRHLVQVPVFSDASQAWHVLRFPDFSHWLRSDFYAAALTVAVVASLETLLNLDAIDKVDPKQRRSPPSRELVAQGIGNMTSGLVGGLPVTSVVVRGSVNLAAGAQSKLSAILHGLLLLVCVVALPHVLNTIPLASLAAILIFTGFKLASPRLAVEMWQGGKAQLFPFLVTVGTIVGIDLLWGVISGLATALAFILHSNLRRPIKRVLERHMAGDVLRIELGEQVGFFNRAALEKSLDEVQAGQHVLIDARNSAYVDPDVLDMIHDFERKTAPARGVEVSLVGFKSEYSRLQDKIRFVDYSTREVQSALTPTTVLRLLREGNRRFRTGSRVARDFQRQIDGAAAGAAPLAVVLSCIDSRMAPALVFDLGLGDILSIRVSGNVVEDRVLGSMEFGTVVAGAKLIVVLGHTECIAMESAVYQDTASPAVGDECLHLHGLLHSLREAVEPLEAPPYADSNARAQYLDRIALRNVERTLRTVRERSPVLDRLVRDDQIAIVGGMYDVRTGEVAFYEAEGCLSVDELDPPRTESQSPASESPQPG